MSHPFANRARIILRREASGWFTWRLVDDFGGAIGPSGKERRRNAATKAASAARDAWNKANPPTLLKGQREKPIATKSGEWTDGFTR